MRVMNSSRVRWSERKMPVNADVVVADCCTVASVIVSVPLPFAAAFAVGKLLRYLLSDESYTKIA